MALVSRTVILILLVIVTTAASAATPRSLHVFYIPGILQWTDAGQEESKEALRLAIESAPQREDYRAAYPTINYSFLENSLDTPADLATSKKVEEQYIDGLRAAFREGGPNSNVKKLNVLTNLYFTYLQKEHGLLFGTHVIDAVNAGLPQVVDELRRGADVVLVAHSHGNIIANYIYAGVAAMADLGIPALAHLRIVSVGSVALFSPNNLVVNTYNDGQVYVALPALGATDPKRRTPYCQRGDKECPFAAMPATATTSCSGWEHVTCHAFVGAYLSDFAGTASFGERLSGSVHFVANDYSIRHLVTDTFFTALDQMQGNSYSYKDWALIYPTMPYWSNPWVTSKGPGKFQLDVSNGDYGSGLLWSQWQFDYGGIVEMHACIAKTLASTNIIWLADINLNGLIDDVNAYRSAPPIGAYTTYQQEYGGNLILVDGSGQRHQVVTAAVNGKRNSSYCGVYRFGVCPDQTAVVQFVNDIGNRETHTFHPTTKVSGVVRRLFALQYRRESTTIDSLQESSLPFDPPHPPKPPVYPKVCTDPENP
jgi:hypothetical protein